jgi:hypothetical protein
MEIQNQDYKVKLEKTYQYVSLWMVEGTKIAILEANSAYIPMQRFNEVLGEIGGMAKQGKIKKLIFDKRKLTVFHQPSMEWYFTEWKEEVFDYGLKTHRKILPEDKVFRMSVEIGREKINKDYPHAKFHQMDIQYFETLEEAIEK